jgi:hypothetical protein
VGNKDAQHYHRRRRPIRPATGPWPAAERLSGPDDHQPDARGHRHRKGDVEPIHVQRLAASRARPRHQFLGEGVSEHGRARRHHRGARRRQGGVVGLHPRQARTGCRSAGQISRLDEEVRRARRRTGDPRSRRRRSGKLCPQQRSRDPGRRQGRHRQAVRTGRRTLALRQTAARAL